MINVLIFLKATLLKQKNLLEGTIAEYNLENSTDVSGSKRAHVIISDKLY